MGYQINGNTKIITLTTGTTSVSIRDLWSRWVDWFLTGDNSKYLPAFTQVGGDIIDSTAGTSIPIYAFLMNGWKIRPQESNHTLSVNDGILLVNGGGDPFMNTIGAYTIRINYQQPVQAISFTTSGGNGSSVTKEEIRQELDNNSLKLAKIEELVDELHKIGGLDPLNPSTVTTTNLTAGTINIDLTGDGINTSTFTRND